MAKKCPLIGKKCIESECMFWVHILGHHPQSDAPLDHFDCSVRWLPILMIEGSKETRGAAAAIETFRNEMVVANERLLGERYGRLQQPSGESNHEDPRVPRLATKARS